MRKKYRHDDTPEQIAECLRCVKPRCNNCIEFALRTGRTECLKTQDVSSKIVELFNQGASVLRMSAETGRSVNAIYGTLWRRGLSIKKRDAE